MRYVFFLTVAATFFIFLPAVSQDEKSFIELHGSYQGKNLYVQNPFTSNMKEYCTNSVIINGEEVLGYVESSAYEIDLSKQDHNKAVSIMINHKSDCKPKVLNPQVIQLKSNFHFSGLVVDENKINWVVSNEPPKGRYFIERFEYNSWSIIAEKYTEGDRSYIKDINHHSGQNRYRIRFEDHNGTEHFSEVVSFNSELEPIEVYPRNVDDKLFLTREADYIILDQYGNTYSKGRKKEIDMGNADKGVYYINVDNNHFKFFKK